MLVLDRVTFLLPAGAYKAIDLTGHEVFQRIEARGERSKRGWYVWIKCSTADREILVTLLDQVASGAWPSTAYGRKACRTAVRRLQRSAE